MADETNKEVNSELRREGIPPPRKTGVTYDTDDTMFKADIINPVMPVEYAKDTYEDPITGEKQSFVHRLPKYVPTMTLGNLTWKEMKALRYKMVNARILERLGYMGISADIHVNYTDTVITSQCHQGFLLRAVLTEQYFINRNEQSAQKLEDTTAGDERASPLGKLWDSIRHSQQKPAGVNRYDDTLMR